MRFYGLDDFLRTLSRGASVDVETLRMGQVDIDAAILALATGGGPPTASDDRTDTSEKLFRLIQALVVMRPYNAGQHDAVAADAARDYAKARGYRLDLPDRGVTLANLIAADDVSPAQARRALRKGLVVVGSPVKSSQRPLRSAAATLSRAVSNPSENLRTISDYLARRADRIMIDQGLQVRRPVPRQHVSNVGERDGLDRGERASAARTGVLLQESIARTCASDLVTILDDPQGQGSCVEREWALRLPIPVIELRLHRTISPHQDGSGRVWSITVDHGRPQAAVAQFELALRRMTPAILDHVAYRQAVEIKNEATLAYLRASWNTLSSEERDRASEVTGMSRPYIEGLLSSTMALELASERQRRALELVLSVHRPSASTHPISRAELELLGTVGASLGLSGPRLLLATEGARGHLQRSRRRPGHLDAVQARAILQQCVRDLDRDD